MRLYMNTRFEITIPLRPIRLPFFSELHAEITGLFDDALKKVGVEAFAAREVASPLVFPCALFAGRGWS